MGLFLIPQVRQLLHEDGFSHRETKTSCEGLELQDNLNDTTPKEMYIKESC